MNRHSRNFSISLTPAVYAALQARVDSANVTRSAYIETVLTQAFLKGGNPFPEVPAEFREPDPAKRKRRRRTPKQ